MRVAVGSLISLYSLFAPHAAAQEGAVNLRRAAASDQGGDHFNALEAAIGSMKECAARKGPNACSPAYARVAVAAKIAAEKALKDREGLFEDDPPVVANPQTHAAGTIFSDCDEGSGTNNGSNVSQEMEDCCNGIDGCHISTGETTTNNLSGCEETQVICDCGDGWGMDDLAFLWNC
mmetsp:Transcript_50734/g.108131  ORF Transcript_50734/g.108131 Transcript_50734/m.108131 type:complete len:177 (-) Transcript_50734:146-676(-)|eukprot:CAMPEP_0172530194 /NCGR_PEP_ID=MMETSP1067-20121228/4004_1 /TAXON_ID=265564 ORGANISM="Thalassiosira punctigera, Strain Tpunct2005C2" /NCGR_SAMPLE_ID=MMETSP1067 /ASSEMBLY_ACC=CAM_ASM_000444 /LENGTH=176 /DNA_ID=CAMNT_0013314349 /DNA_START=79 /DNA_END=609 /DNA_ORIENTATION=+